MNEITHFAMATAQAAQPRGYSSPVRTAVLTRLVRDGQLWEQLTWVGDGGQPMSLDWQLVPLPPGPTFDEFLVQRERENRR